MGTSLEGENRVCKIVIEPEDAAVPDVAPKMENEAKTAMGI